MVYLGYGSLVGSGMLFADIPVELLTESFLFAELIY